MFIARTADISDHRANLANFKEVRTDVNTFQTPSLFNTEEKIREYASPHERPTKLDIKQVTSRARATEAMVDKKSVHQRMSYIHARQPVRGVKGEMRHSANMSVLLLDLEQAKADHGTEMQRFNLQSSVVREGARSYHHVMEEGLVAETMAMATSLSVL